MSFTAFAERHNRALTISTALAIFAADRLLPVFALPGVMYLVVVLLSLWAPTSRDTWAAAILASVLTAADIPLSDYGANTPYVILNRTAVILALWMVAVVCLWQRRRTREETGALARANQAMSENREVQIGRAHV